MRFERNELHPPDVLMMVPGVARRWLGGAGQRLDFRRPEMAGERGGARTRSVGAGAHRGYWMIDPPPSERITTPLAWRSRAPAVER